MKATKKVRSDAAVIEDFENPPAPLKQKRPRIVKVETPEPPPVETAVAVLDAPAETPPDPEPQSPPATKEESYPPDMTLKQYVLLKRPQLKFADSLNEPNDRKIWKTLLSSPLGQQIKIWFDEGAKLHVIRKRYFNEKKSLDRLNATPVG